MFQADAQPSQRPLVGTSPRMAQLNESIRKLDGARWPVLILGETGTGKEVVARQIHSRGTRGPFVVVDCSAIPPTLMESELFGAVKGAYTGATGPRTGLIEAANGGTAFFDEVGELPLDVQAKLLRVLQEKEFRPVGSTQPRRSDFRIVAATNRDLAADVERGTFRRDLFFRLKVITLRIPALRERLEDIPELVKHFLGRYGGHYSVTPEAFRLLMGYDWPGNVRELENCVQHMVAVNSGPLLHLDDLPSTVMNRVQAVAPPLVRMAAAFGTSVTPQPYNAEFEASEVDESRPIIPLPELERKEILRALRHTRGDRTTAAMMLGIGRTTLYRKLKEYGVEA